MECRIALLFHLKRSMKKQIDAKAIAQLWKAQRAFHAIAHRITFNVIRTTLNNKGKLNARKLGYNCSKLV